MRDMTWWDVSAKNKKYSRSDQSQLSWPKYSSILRSIFGRYNHVSQGWSRDVASKSGFTFRESF